MAHFSDTAAAGKKLRVSGSEGDEHVKTSLTDHLNSYVEIQAGLFADQSQYEFLNPQEIRRFTEYWIPFRDLNGLSRANPKAAVFLERAKTKEGKAELTVQVMTTEPAPSSKIEVTCVPLRFSMRPLTLDPLRRSRGKSTVKIPPLAFCVYPRDQAYLSSSTRKITTTSMIRLA